MKVSTFSRSHRRTLAGAMVVVVAALLAQCGSSAGSPPTGPVSAAASDAAFDIVCQVLQHPRCVNCHPAGRAPLQGDDSHPHGQNVQGGPDGKGLFAMRCSNCHLDQNTPGANLPPGAPNWHLPPADMPLVFEGRRAADLARQLADPAQNGGRTPAQLLKHVAEDPLVLWGWNPGEGRTPVPIPHAEFVDAMRTWIDGGCQVPMR